MHILGSGQPPVAPNQQSGDAVVDVTTESFMKDVVEGSMGQLVLVDFWAPWCGPCKQLGPVLEKIALASKGKIRLAKMNIDDEPAIPGQLGVQSIPAVYAFKDGRPADAFVGVQPESQIKQFIERLIGPLGPEEVGPLLEAADSALADGQIDEALQGYFSVLQHDEENVQAFAGIIKSNIGAGDLEAAAETLDALDDEMRQKSEIQSAELALEMAQKASELGDLNQFETAIYADKNDHAARAHLAEGLAAMGKKAEAIDHLIYIIETDRQWDEDGGRRRLVDLFEAWGPTDPMTLSGRRKLSSVLFR